jgi:hypothetical protein
LQTAVTKHCCPAAEKSLPFAKAAEAGTTVDVAASTEDAHPIMYMLACVSIQNAGQLRATEGTSTTEITGGPFLGVSR